MSKEIDFSKVNEEDVVSFRFIPSEDAITAVVRWEGAEHTVRISITETEREFLAMRRRECDKTTLLCIMEQRDTRPRRDPALEKPIGYPFLRHVIGFADITRADVARLIEALKERDRALAAMEAS